MTSNVATSGSALTISGVICNGTNGTTPTTALTKAGAGTLILTGAQSYTGATTVTAGVLRVDAAGSINASSGITVNGATARFLDTGTVAVSAPVTVTLGTLDGTGTVGSATIANAAGAIVTHGNSTTSPLTVGSLTFNGAATMNLFTSPATAATAKIATTNLTTNAAGKGTINATNTAGFWDSGSYSAVSYTGAIGGAGFSAFQLPVSPATLAGLGGRQTAALDNATPGLMKIVIGGDRAQWTGTGDNNWDTTAHASKNFKLSSAATATDFVANDAVLFDDTASGTTVSLTGNVAPVNTVFNNSTKNYTLQASGAFGITSGSVIKNGTGSLTISNSNTYTGGTILNAGTLNINNATAIGGAASALTLNGGTLDNTSGAAITLANNNPSNLNGNITFTGTSDLGLGTGRVTLLGNSSINVAGASSTLSMGQSSAPAG